MSDLIICKFAHNASLQARGNRVRIFTSEGVTFSFEIDWQCVIWGAVYIEENVAHLFTTAGVFNADGREGGMIIQKIGPEL